MLVCGDVGKVDEMGLLYFVDCVEVISKTFLVNVNEPGNSGTDFLLLIIGNNVHKSPFYGKRIEKEFSEFLIKYCKRKSW